MWATKAMLYKIPTKKKCNFFNGKEIYMGISLQEVSVSAFDSVLPMSPEVKKVMTKHMGKGTWSIPSRARIKREGMLWPTQLIQVKVPGTALPKWSQLSFTVLNLHFETAGKKCLVQNLLSLMIQQCGPETQSSFIYSRPGFVMHTLPKLEGDPYDYSGPHSSPELSISFV